MRQPIRVMSTHSSQLTTLPTQEMCIRDRLQALPGELVEGLVVHATHIGDHLDLVVGRGVGGSGARGLGLVATAAACDGKGEDAGKGETHETILLHVLPFLRTVVACKMGA